MRRLLIFAVAALAIPAVAQAQIGPGQIGQPGVQYSSSIAAGEGGQMFPWDQQDPWLHGQYQRVPAYGGFASFRPYNYRHVLSQTQIAGVWGHSHGMPYSQQFWNKYRGSYLDQKLHSQSIQPAPLLLPGPGSNIPQMAPGQAYPLMPASSPVRSPGEISAPVYQTGFLNPALNSTPTSSEVAQDGRPISVFPAGVSRR